MREFADPAQRMHLAERFCRLANRYSPLRIAGKDSIGLFISHSSQELQLDCDMVREINETVGHFKSIGPIARYDLLFRRATQMTAAVLILHGLIE